MIYDDRKRDRGKYLKSTKAIPSCKIAPQYHLSDELVPLPSRPTGSKRLSIGDAMKKKVAAPAARNVKNPNHPGRHRSKHIANATAVIGKTTKAIMNMRACAPSELIGIPKKN